ncbi:hypothetical protein [Brevundimonas sp.]|uniref:hypothetical protein n=1 Tax=Brevundimonas sp. TaxID=1871086 RepID=UPI002737BD44|nr:hypothetical protein [Brevundimonas sp.]MDP3801294.1 hypothetical protein [Brevundimonas sp.]
MKNAGAKRFSRIEQASRRRVRSERVETALIVALACLVLFKGGPAIAGIVLGISEMFMALVRLSIPA